MLLGWKTFSICNCYLVDKFNGLGRLCKETITRIGFDVRESKNDLFFSSGLSLCPALRRRWKWIGHDNSWSSPTSSLLFLQRIISNHVFIASFSQNGVMLWEKMCPSPWPLSQDVLNVRLFGLRFVITSKMSILRTNIDQNKKTSYSFGITSLKMCLLVVVVGNISIVLQEWNWSFSKRYIFLINITSNLKNAKITLVWSNNWLIIKIYGDRTTTAIINHNQNYYLVLCQ